MSLDISGTRFVRVYDTEMKLQISDKIIFARLSTSRKTGGVRIDKETGDILTGEGGKPLSERVFSSWDARFVGNAFEPAKGLRAGQQINIANGWIVNEPFKKKNGKTGYSTYVTITEFSVCDIVDENEDEDNE